MLKTGQPRFMVDLSGTADVRGFASIGEVWAHNVGYCDPATIDQADRVNHGDEGIPTGAEVR